SVGRRGDAPGVRPLRRERPRFGLRRQGRQDEVVGENLVVLDLRVVLPPDVVPLLIAGLRVGEREVEGHEEGVRDEESEIHHGRKHEGVAERSLAVEEAKAAAAVAAGAQIAASVAASKRYARFMSNQSSAWLPGRTPAWSSVSIWKTPAALRAVAMTRWPSGSTTSIVAGTLAGAPRAAHATSE